ncbi:DeoR/GlpR family DNA-binding transcription regulator [Streptomyces sp. BE20]|uniref:DeoR/GlpR family DNA-binding transcription regulator n=1 Tax=unclassified Streptomyces TaxID=2593676 RepID=UPI002E7874E7|nr:MULTISPECIES: DeoR/GlpR family DNA-binding transcription regulator [unclassified Streptomyces]MED7948820.1 DeoR/GlpR family DNA-binding transcription regulator [Streptomyces sp. BE303]MEE1821309.1 DeoR/GlpR family DNA-binding transcription regulator [Streptomyces sp. BE20]
MYAPERQQQILRLAQQRGRVDVPSLAEEFGVTQETIRRDLSTLDRAGLLRRVHGGALPTGVLNLEPGLAERDTTAAGEKERIAAATLALLPTEGSVLLDAGTTVSRLAALLPLDSPLTVVTHALPIAARLADHPALTLHLVGGRLRHRTQAAVDAWALRDLADVHADVAVVATNGFSPEVGLSTPDLAEAAVKRAMVAGARLTVLVADSSKYGARHFARFGSLEDIDILVTDTGLTDEQTAAIENHGPKVIRA